MFSPVVKAFGSTALISILPTIILPFIPVDRSNINSCLHRVLLAFACGGMLGDVFLHLLPHLLGGEIGHGHGHEEDHNFDIADGSHHGHDHDHSAAIWIGLFIMLGFTVFFIADKLLRARHGGDSHCHSHSHGHSTKDKLSDDEDNLDDMATNGLHQRKKGKGGKSKSKDSNNLKQQQEGGPLSRLGAGGWLNLAADMMHNATDGLAIGVSFASGHGIGIATTISTLAHELPHEIGDYAVLIKNGLSKKEAILAQFCTAIGAFIGTAVGLIAHSFEELQPILLGFTAGGFVYVACVSVVPEILSTNSTVIQTLFEAMGIGLGVGLMVIVAMYE